MLVTTKEMFKKAYEGGYAIGAFNVNNMELIQGIVGAVSEEKSPLILQMSRGARKYANPIYLRKLIEAAMEVHPELQIAPHLDHGDSLELVKQCIKDGFTSVMIDGSQYPFEENIRITKEVCDYAHDYGVVVEAELGKLVGMSTDEGGEFNPEAVYTDPDEAVEFVERTKCDSLAVTIGTSHGAFKFKGTPKLDFPRLEKITEKMPGFPLVLHGASSVLQKYVKMCNDYGGELPGAQGVPEEMITRASKLGVCKVNIDTDLRLAMTAAIRKHFAEKPVDFDPRKYLVPARDAIKEIVKHKLQILGCTGKL